MQCNFIYIILTFVFRDVLENINMIYNDLKIKYPKSFLDQFGPFVILNHLTKFACWLSQTCKCHI